MPAGDLITGDWQLELQGLLIGDGTLFEIPQAGSITGLLDLSTKTAEMEYTHADGSFAGESFNSARTASISIEVRGATPTAAFDNFELLRAAWAPVTSAVPLYFRFPGIGKRYVDGVPGPVSVDIRQAAFNIVRVLAMFRITDPTIQT